MQPASPPLVISSSSKKEENGVRKRPASPPVVVASSEKGESDIKKQPGISHINSYSMSWYKTHFFLIYGSEQGS